MTDKFRPVSRHRKSDNTSLHPDHVLPALPSALVTDYYVQRMAEAEARRKGTAMPELKKRQKLEDLKVAGYILWMADRGIKLTEIALRLNRPYRFVCNVNSGKVYSQAQPTKPPEQYEQEHMERSTETPSD